MKCFSLTAEMQLLHEVGLTSASATWLLFSKMQTRGPLITVLRIGMAEYSLFETVHQSPWPLPSAAGLQGDLQCHLRE